MNRIIVIGTSLGGKAALKAILPKLPADFPAPIVVVQHRGVDLGDDFARTLGAMMKLPVVEPCDKDPIEPSRIYIAPAEYHLLVDRSAWGDRFALSTEGPVCYARPSIDVLFESAAMSRGAETIAVVLTGANRDGARGAARIKAAGGIVVVQDPATAEASAMPEAVLAALKMVVPDKVLPLSEIGAYLCGLVVRP